MTAATIATVTYGQALRFAVEALKAKLEAVPSINAGLDPGLVWSEMQNICINTAEALGYREVDTVIAVRLTRHLLPASLRYLYDESMRRSVAPLRGSHNYVVNFNVVGLLYTINASLKQI